MLLSPHNILSISVFYPGNFSSLFCCSQHCCFHETLPIRVVVSRKRHMCAVVSSFRYVLLFQGIFKLVSWMVPEQSPRIDTKEPIPPGCVARQASTTTHSYSVPSPHWMFKSASSGRPVRQPIPTRFLASIDCLKIPAQSSVINSWSFPFEGLYRYLFFFVSV